jgi:hypothetical protein
MTLKIVLILIVALAAIAVPYYFFNDRSVENGAQLRNATDAADHRDVELQQCLARVELDYVEDVKREYISGPFKTPSPIGLTQEIRDRIERKKNSAVADCQKVYGPNTSFTPSP